MIRRTTTLGLTAINCSKTYHPKTNSYSGWTSRVRVVKGNPFFDEYADWDDNGKAIGHIYGDLLPPTPAQNEVVTGFNFFDCLRGVSQAPVKQPKPIAAKPGSKNISFSG